MVAHTKKNLVHTLRGAARGHNGHFIEENMRSVPSIEDICSAIAKEVVRYRFNQ